MSNRLFVALSLLLCFGACRENSSKKAKLEVADTSIRESVGSVSVDTLSAVKDSSEFTAWMHTLEQPLQRFHVTANEESIVEGAKGIRLRIQPSDLEYLDGSSPKTGIAVELIELHRKADFILAQMPTVSGGRMLESGGAYYINLTAGGKQLRLKKGRSLGVLLPKISSKEMELFYASNDAAGDIDWKPAGKDFRSFPNDIDGKTEAGTFTSFAEFFDEEKDSVLVRVPILKYRDSIITVLEPRRDRRPMSPELDKNIGYQKVVKMVDGAICLVALIPDTTNQQYRTELRRGRSLDILASKFYDEMRIDQFGWINCDRFLPDELIAMDIQLPDDISFERIKTFFVFQDVNSVLEETLVPDGRTALPVKSLPSGRQAKVVALSWFKGTPYASVHTTTLTRGVPIKLNLKPTTKAEVERMIEGV